MRLGTEIIATAQALEGSGLAYGGFGSVSARTATGMLITPAVTSYSRLGPDEIVAMDFDGSWFATGELRPNPEWRLHLDILGARPDIDAVVHSHSTFASVLAAHGREISAVHHSIGLAGGDSIRCARYATVGSPELSAQALAALHQRRGCLLRNHGALALGFSLGNALVLARQIEELAKISVFAASLGEVQPIDASEMDNVVPFVECHYGAGAKVSR